MLSFCRKRVKSFDITLEPFSHFGAIKESAVVFFIGLLFYLILRMLFVGQIITYFSLWNHYWVVGSYLVALLSILLAAFLPVKPFASAHFFVARLIVVSSMVFLLSLSVALWKPYVWLALLSFGVFLSILVIGRNFIEWKKTTVMTQLNFLIPIILWDWAMTLKLFL